MLYRDCWDEKGTYSSPCMKQTQRCNSQGSCSHSDGYSRTCFPGVFHIHRSTGDAVQF